MNEKEYIDFKIEKLNSLIENATSQEQKEIYEQYKKEFLEKHKEKEKVNCEICNRILLIENYDKHFDNCKTKKLEAEKKAKEQEKAEQARMIEEARLRERKEQLKKELAELEAKNNETE